MTDKIPKFCKECGDKLKVISVKTKFDERTGEAIFMLWELKCPNFSFYARDYNYEHHTDTIHEQPLEKAVKV